MRQRPPPQPGRAPKQAGDTRVLLPGATLRRASIIAQARAQALLASEPEDDNAPTQTVGEDVTAPQPPRMPAKLTCGTRIGKRYVIERLLGRGGMGAVYLAHDELLGKAVALKLLHVESEETLARLREEVRLAQRVTHKNICRTFDIEEIDGTHVVKMEPIDGETVTQRIQREGPLSIEQTVTLVREVAVALQAAHEQGIVHRDLKPQNIVIERHTGRVVLMDFGIACRVDPESTTERARWGTPDYLAPELLDSDADAVATPASDRYALGCVMYECLTGKPPFSAKTMLQISLGHLHRPVPDPRAARNELPSWVADVTMHLLAKTPAQRYPSDGALVEALAGPAPPVAEPSPRRWLLAVPLALLLMLGIAGLRHTLRAKATATWEPIVVDRPSYIENADAPAISPDNRWLAYTSNRSGNWRIYVEPIDSRAGKPRALTSAEGTYYNLRWSHDGGSLLAIAYGWQAVRIPLAGGSPDLLATGAAQVEDCAGRLVVAQVGVDCGENCARRIVVYPELTGVTQMERPLVELPQPTQLQGMRCDRSGTKLVYAAALGTDASVVVPHADIYQVPIAGGPVRQLTFDHRQNTWPFFHPDGRSIFFSARRGETFQLWELPIAGGQPRQVTRVGPALAADIAPDGRYLIYDHDTTAIALFARSADGQRRRFNQRFDDVSQPLPAAGGHELIARQLRQDDMRSYAVAMSLDGSEGERVLTAADLLALTADGHDLVYAVHPLDNAGAVLQRLPLARGTPRELARLPGRVFSLYVDENAAYAETGEGLRRLVWRIPLDGRAATQLEQPDSNKVIPAPVGGWRLVDRMSDPGVIGQRWRLVPPGARLDNAAAQLVSGSDPVWVHDGRSLLLWNGREIRRVYIDGHSEILTASRERPRGMALGRDGRTLYIAEYFGQVQRKSIVNLADRPRP